MKLELWYPIKIYTVSQGWGVFNPFYLQFDSRIKNADGTLKPYQIIDQKIYVDGVLIPNAFCRHNGIDIPLTADGKLRAPIRMKIQSQQFFPTGGGNQVQTITTEKWVVPHLDNRECYIMFVFMHNKSFLHQVGDILEVGDEIAIPDNTGSSTGPHCHMGGYRLNDDLTFMDTNDANNSFDFSFYWNKYYAADKSKVVSTLNQILALLQNFWANYKGR